MHVHRVVWSLHFLLYFFWLLNRLSIKLNFCIFKKTIKHFQSTPNFFLIQWYIKSGKFKSCKYGEDNYKSNKIFLSLLPSSSARSLSGCPCVNKQVVYWAPLHGRAVTVWAGPGLLHLQTFQLFLLCQLHGSRITPRFCLSCVCGKPDNSASWFSTREAFYVVFYIPSQCGI